MFCPWWLHFINIHALTSKRAFFKSICSSYLVSSVDQFINILTFASSKTYTQRSSKRVNLLYASRHFMFALSIEPDWEDSRVYMLSLVSISDLQPVQSDLRRLHEGASVRLSRQTRYWWIVRVHVNVALGFQWSVCWNVLTSPRVMSSSASGSSWRETHTHTHLFHCITEDICIVFHWLYIRLLMF